MSKPISNKKFKTHRDKLYTWHEKPNQALSNVLPKDRTYTYVEPCAGAGDLIDVQKTMSSNFKCIQAIDIEPDVDWIQKLNALDVKFEDCDYIITNPPFSQSSKKEICFPLLEKSIDHAREGVYLLLPGNWIYNSDFQNYMEYARYIVPIGRFQWFNVKPDGTPTNDGETRDCAWYYFTKTKEVGGCRILPRTT